MSSASLTGSIKDGGFVGDDLSSVSMPSFSAMLSLGPTSVGRLVKPEVGSYSIVPSPV